MAPRLSLHSGCRIRLGLANSRSLSFLLLFDMIALRVYIIT